MKSAEDWAKEYQHARHYGLEHFFALAQAEAFVEGRRQAAVGQLAALCEAQRKALRHIRGQAQNSAGGVGNCTFSDIADLAADALSRHRFDRQMRKDVEGSEVMACMRIPLTQGQEALVDVDDYKRVAAFRWHATKDKQNYYAARSVTVSPGKRMTLRMHRFIMGCPPDMVVDHINGNGLDNRRHNLRICTSLENRRNRTAARSKTGSYKGVYLRAGGRWEAQMTAGRKNYSLGRFDSEKEASLAYDIAHLIIQGEFARLNNPWIAEKAREVLAKWKELKK